MKSILSLPVPKEFEVKTMIGSDEDPEQKVINEIYKHLLPIIICDWKEKSSPKKAEFSTVASEVSLVDPEPSYVAEVKFTNGNSFRGDVKDDRLHGSGIYLWSDGSMYEGSFRGNRLEGEGKVTYSSGERYTGQVSYGFHHGKGLFISDTVKYGGEFDGGMLHGKGNLETNEGKFDGMFKEDKIFEGTRIYDDGLFMGKFNALGERTEGCFLLKNGDMYKGSWQQDHYCDLGVYQWSPRLDCNKLIYAQVNYFVGYWADSFRCGPGVLYFDERMILGWWKMDGKAGIGVIVAANGDTFVGEKMLTNTHHGDVFKVNKSQDTDKHVLVLRRFMNEATRLSWGNKTGDYDLSRDLEWMKPIRFETIVPKEVNYLTVSAEKEEQPPLFQAKHTIDIKSTPIVDFVAEFLPDVDRGVLESVEIKSINQVFASHLKVLDKLYESLARYGREDAMHQPMHLLRVGLWRFLRPLVNLDAKFNIVNFLNEAEYSFHLISENRADPFEVIYFWQFLKYVLCATMCLNRNQVVANQALERRSPYFGLFGTMVIIFLQEYEKIGTGFVDNLPKVVNADVFLAEHIFEYIRKYQPYYLVRNTYNIYRDVCEKVKSYGTGENYLNFDDFVTSLAEVYPSAVRDGILIHVDDPLTQLEVFELIVLLIAKALRNIKYSVEKQKFTKKVYTKFKTAQTEAETESLKQSMENLSVTDSKKNKKNKRNK